jgi:flagellin-like hook-associated protein FlgL
MTLNISNNSAVFFASNHLTKYQASAQNSIKKLASGKREILTWSSVPMTAQVRNSYELVLTILG